MTPTRLATGVLRALAALAALAVIGGGALLAQHFRFAAPFMDGVSVEFFLTRTFLSSWSPADALHFIDNEHRPVIPVYLYALDHRFFAARGEFLQWVSFALIALTPTALVAGLGWRRRSPAATALWLLAPMAALLWPGHWENLLWSKQVTVYCALFFVVAGFAAVSRADASPDQSRRGVLWTGAAAAAGLCAGLSFAYGYVFWPVALAAAFVRRWRRDQVLILCSAALVAAALAVLGHKPNSGFTSPGDALLRPFDLFSYAGMMLGDPLRRLGVWTTPAMGLGEALLLATLAAAVFSARRRGDDLTPAGRLGLMLMVFTVGAAGMVAIGRLDIGLELAASSRYLVIGVLWWIGAALWLSDKVPPLWGAGAAAVAMLLLLVAAGPQIREMQAFDQRVRLGAAAGVVGARLPAGEETLHPRADWLAEVFAAHREGHKGVYAQAWPYWIGQRLDAAVTIRDEARCLGGVVGEATKAPGAWRLQGTAEGGGIRRSGRVVFTNGDGVVVGFAAARRRAPDWAWSADPLNGPVAWTGFVPRDAGPVQPWVLNRGVACRLG